MSEGTEGKKTRSRPRGCGCWSGCGGFLLVFVLGGALSLVNAVFAVVCAMTFMIGGPVIAG